jgi:PPOX class probable F420-dependent enzyme
MENLAQFKKQKYISVETFRKSGESVRTPVWFVESGGKFYFNTVADSGKVKRIRRNPQVMFAPSTMSGDPLGGFISGTATLLNETEAADVEKLYARKYGLMKKVFDLMGNIRKDQRVFVSITPGTSIP